MQDASRPALRSPADHKAEEYRQAAIHAADPKEIAVLANDMQAAAAVGVIDAAHARELGAILNERAKSGRQ